MFLELLNSYWPAIALVLPMVQAVAVRYDAGTEIKLGASVFFAVVAVVLSALDMSWSAVTPELVFERGFILWGIGQAWFWTADKAISKTSNSRFNDLAIFLPSKGIG